MLLIGQLVTLDILILRYLLGLVSKSLIILSTCHLTIFIPTYIRKTVIERVA